MIKQEVVSEIFDRAHIEDVVGDFVHLKKRGANMLGLCPFHNEKTPSFNVSPSKGIYKCFGCGKGGNSVNFIMEHEHLTYPEALKFLARKYNIEVEEKELSPEEKQAIDTRESLLIVNEAATKFFQTQMREGEEGKDIGLSYFMERGMDLRMIERFALGYCPEDKKQSFTDFALAKGFQKKYLIQTGLTKEGQRGLYDFYHGRVIFPIRSISGRSLGFGGRTLKSDKSIAKYFNSPESEIYHKSKVLYGLFESKSAIVKQDKCYMVEGYMDVISLHQAGIENVVASSGTSLTVEQIRLLRRYTPHITILYDSDNAGVKAAMRGIDLLLEEGMKVRVVSLPEGDDPDTMAQRLGQEAMLKFLEDESKDFFSYMCDKLLKGRSQDPIDRSKAIQDIIRSLAMVPDKIERSLEIQSIALKLGIDQRVVNEEIGKAQRKREQERSKEQERAKLQEQRANQRSNTPPAPPPGFSSGPSAAPPPAAPPPSDEFQGGGVGFNEPPPPGEFYDAAPQAAPMGPDDMQGFDIQSEPPMEAVDQDMLLASALLDKLDNTAQEMDIIRLLVTYGQDIMHIEVEDAEEDENGDLETEEISVEVYVVEELSADPYIRFKDSFCAKVWAIYQTAYAEERSIDNQTFLRHPDSSISQRVASMLSEKHELHRWADRQIYPTHESEQLTLAIDTAIDRFRIRTVLFLIRETQNTIPAVENDPVALSKTINRLNKLNQLKMQLSERAGTVILDA